MTTTESLAIENVEAAVKLCERLDTRSRVATERTRPEIVDRVIQTAVDRQMTGSFQRYLDRRLGPLLEDEFNLRSPRYIGHMTGPVDPMLIALAVVVTFINTNSVKMETARVVTEIERQRVSEWHDLVFGSGDSNAAESF